MKAVPPVNFPFSVRARKFITGLCAMSSLGPAIAIADEFAEVTRSDSGFRFELAPSRYDYYLLERSINLADWDAFRIGIARSGPLYLEAPFIPQSDAGFYRVTRLDAFSPQDSDRDGIDDLLEIEALGLDPLDPNDANRIPPGETMTFREIYRIRFGRDIPDNEVFSREASLFNYGSAFSSFDSVSKEVVIYNFGTPPGGTYESISKEVSVFNGEVVPPTEFGQSISRELAVYNFGTPPGGYVETLSRELSVYNGQIVPPTLLSQAVSREISVYNHGSVLLTYDALSREVTVLNFQDSSP